MGKQEWRLILVLTVICVVSGGVLGWVNALTAPVIKTQRELAKQRALQKRCPRPLLLRKRKPCQKSWKARPGQGSWKYTVLTMMGKQKGFVFIVDQRGYAGPIRMVIGVTPLGNLSGANCDRSKRNPRTGGEDHKR